MQYKKIYINHFLKIRLFTNSKTILKLVDNFLDFSDIHLSKPKIKIDFYLDEFNHKSLNGSNNFLYQSRLDKDNTLLSLLGNKIAALTTNPKTGMVKASILNYQESYKESLLDFIFTQPMHFYLAHHGLFFLHASVVSRGKDCTLITGPQDSGKSTLALTLAQNGFNLLADDDCFVKLIRGQARLFPFPTKMGLNDRILKKYPQLNKHTLGNYRYGGKRRLSLNSLFNSVNTNGLECRMIISPIYKADSNISLRRLSKEKSLDRLAKDNLTIYDKVKLSKLSINNFWALSNLTSQADSFELIYNENNLNKIAEIIKKVGNFKD